MASKTYFITGGGTGGHIYPAIAVADELLKKDDVKIYYVGNPNNMEAEITKDKPYSFLPVKSFGMPRKLGFTLLKWAICMFFGSIRCCFYILKFRPDAVFGTGGYVSAPVLFAAITCSVPFVLHDCDANPGLVTRKLAPFAKSVSIAFDLAKRKLKNDNVYLNGNPIREEFSTLDKKTARKNLGLDDKITLCVMGGSQGARTINYSVISIIKTLTKDYDIQVILQTGKKNYDQAVRCLQEIYPEFSEDKNLIIRPYFDKMYEVLKASDIAISRAGSLSISELCASGVATIFIPYPYAAADHQRQNARYMSSNEAGLYLEDADTSSESLLELIVSLIKDPEKLKSIQEAAKALAKYDGVKKIAQQIEAT
jgi:UDP-N-acetylglucosamine--N-acetylmuramyl-(pentapeptide) pyrophosphoryl-undecaprenol N-acetylglucosamine transferase